MSASAAPATLRRRFMVVVNPRAGAGRGAAMGRELCQALTGHGAEVDERRTGAPKDALYLARAAAAEGVEAVVCVGGDGTLSEAANGLMATAPDDRPALGVVAVGTGNDYAKMLDGGPGELVDRLRGGPSRRVDVGRIEAAEPLYFLNNAGAAFLEEATAETDARLRRRGGRGGGRWAYFMGGLRALLRHRPAHITAILDDGEELKGPFSLVHIGIGRYCGGGVDLIPEAQIDDGDLSLALLSARGPLRLARDWLRLERGRGQGLAGFEVRSCQQLRLVGEVLALHIDGELHRLTGPVQASVIPGALEILC